MTGKQLSKLNKLCKKIRAAAGFDAKHLANDLDDARVSL